MDFAGYEGLVAGAAGGLFRALHGRERLFRTVVLAGAGSLAGYFAWYLTFAVWSPLWVIVPADLSARISFAQFTAGVVGGILSGIFTDMTKSHYDQNEKDKGTG